MKTFKELFEAGKPVVTDVKFNRVGADIFFKKHQNTLVKTMKNIISRMGGYDTSDFVFSIKSMEGYEDKDKKLLKKKATQISKAIGIKLKSDVQNKVVDGNVFELDFEIKAGK